MNYAKPYILENPDDPNDKIVILGHYISLQGFHPFKDTDKNENNPLDIDHPSISDWANRNIKKASKFLTDAPIVFFESQDAEVNTILAKELTEKKYLEKLSENESSQVRAMVATHNIPEILYKLYQDDSINVRSEVAKHNNEEILLRMIFSDDNKNDRVLRSMATNNNEVIIDKILDVLDGDFKVEHKDRIFSEIIKHGHEHNFERILASNALSVDNISDMSQVNLPRIHNKIIDELLEDPWGYSDIIDNIASFNNKECLEKIISLAEEQPDLRDDYFYILPLLSIAKQDIPEYQVRLAKMDIEPINVELKKSKHKEVIEIIENEEPIKSTKKSKPRF